MMGQTFKIQLLDKFAAAGETSYTFYANIVNAKMRARIAANALPAYMDHCDGLTTMLQAKGVISDQDFVTFLDLCEG